MTRAILALVALASLARAHSFEPGLLTLDERAPGEFDVVWKSPAVTDALVPRLPARCRPSGGAAADEDGPRLFHVVCGSAGLAGETIAVAGLGGTAVDVIVRVTTRDGRSTTAVLRSDAERFVVPGAATGAAALWVLASYVRLGVGHILGGADHLLFVLGLLLLVDGWRRLLATVSAFTVAHSLTLATAVLGVLAPPTPPIEAAIALSIVLVAVELARPPDAARTLARRRPWLLAFAFGLLHGLGFAGALVDLGLPADHVPLALLGFNLGVEAGQLAFVAVMLPVAMLVRRLPRAARLVPAYAIGGLAVAWTMARVEAFF